MEKYYYITSYIKKSHKGSEGLSNFLKKLQNQDEDVQFKKVTHRTKSMKYPRRHTVVYDTLNYLLRRMDLSLLDSVVDPTKKAIRHTYSFEIPKKDGGARKIIAPSAELKKAHQDILIILQKRLKVLEHNAAYAYTQNRSTKDALIEHQKNNSKYFLKVDIEKFFDSCTGDLLMEKLSHIYPFMYFEEDVLERLSDLATLNNVLPQGMPLSPFLTNMLMVPFDYAFSWYCKNKGLVYTRYADDILISSTEEFSFETVINKIHTIFKNLNYPFKIKESKTRYGTRAGRNWNLGLMLNKDNNITVGHVKKKELKVILYKLYKREITPDDHIQGVFAYLRQIEPTYFHNLNEYCLRLYRLSIRELTKI